MAKQGIETDDRTYGRFSETNTAFNALSRDLGENWGSRFASQRLSLVAAGKAGPKAPLDPPDDALFQYALSEGLDRMNVLTASWGSGKSNLGALRWEPPHRLFDEIVARRSDDPPKLTREVRRVARLCGASATGVAKLDPRWIYSEIQRNHSSCEPSVRQPIQVVESGEPHETEDGLILPTTLRYVVVMAVPMDREMIATAPSLLSEAATSLGYSDAARASLSVAAYIRALGYRAIPSLNGTALSIPIAVQAGLGECARNGLLVTPEHGPCIRLSKVFTDIPLLVDGPLDLGIRSYCQTCGECARNCPSQAISHGAEAWEGHNECNNSGTLKWHVDAKRCLRFWIASGTSCSVCIASCPFTLGAKWWFGLPQRIVRRTAALNRPIQGLDRCFAERKRVASAGFLDLH